MVSVVFGVLDSDAVTEVRRLEDGTNVLRVRFPHNGYGVSVRVIPGTVRVGVVVLRFGLRDDRDGSIVSGVLSNADAGGEALVLPEDLGEIYGAVECWPVPVEVAALWARERGG